MRHGLGCFGSTNFDADESEFSRALLGEGDIEGGSEDEAIRAVSCANSATTSMRALVAIVLMCSQS